MVWWTSWTTGEIVYLGLGGYKAYFWCWANSYPLHQNIVYVQCHTFLSCRTWIFSVTYFDANLIALSSQSQLWFTLMHLNRYESLVGSCSQISDYVNRWGYLRFLSCDVWNANFQTRISLRIGTIVNDWVWAQQILGTFESSPSAQLKCKK